MEHLCEVLTLITARDTKHLIYARRVDPTSRRVWSFSLHPSHHKWTPHLCPVSQTWITDIKQQHMALRADQKEEDLWEDHSKEAKEMEAQTRYILSQNTTIPVVDNTDRVSRLTGRILFDLLQLSKFWTRMLQFHSRRNFMLMLLQTSTSSW